MSSEIIWDFDLIQKYNQSGPRYTSYPTALEFSEKAADKFIKRLKAGGEKRWESKPDYTA